MAIKREIRAVAVSSMYRISTRSALSRDSNPPGSAIRCSAGCVANCDPDCALDDLRNGCLHCSIRRQPHLPWWQPFFIQLAYGASRTQGCVENVHAPLSLRTSLLYSFSWAKISGSDSGFLFGFHSMETSANSCRSCDNTICQFACTSTPSAKMELSRRLSSSSCRFLRVF